MIASAQPYGRRLRGRPAIKLKCLNIVPRYDYRAGKQTGTAQLWADWEWDSWIRPQIDLALINGFNAVKVICMGPGVVEASTSQTYGGTYPDAATLYSRFHVLCDYCTAHGLSLILNTMQGGDWCWGKPDAAATIAAMLTVVGWCETMPSCPVVQIDVCNETNYGRPASWGPQTGDQGAMLTDLAPLIEAAKRRTAIPIAASVNIENAAQWTNSPALYALAPHVDVHDVHLYYLGGPIPALSDLDPFFNSPAFGGTLWIGEYGCTGGESDARVQAYIAGCTTVAADPRCWGQNWWCAAAYHVAQGAGTLYSGAILDQNAANPRAAILTAFAGAPSY